MATGPISLSRREPQLAVVVKRTVPLDRISEALGEMFGQAMGYLMANGIQPSAAPLARYLSMGPEVEMQAGMPVATRCPGEGDVECIELPGGDAVTAIHSGPYDTLGESHEAIQQWFAANGRQPSGAPWECYITDPGEEPDPSKWQTEIVYPA